MRILLAGIGAVCAVAAVSASLFFSAGHAAGPAKEAAPAPSEASDRLVVHEWGTFTSFSGSDGVPVRFTPNNVDLPSFVYHLGDNENAKSVQLNQDGTVSMETPVLYFYTDKDLRASVRVDFPKGWITEWYPFAASQPARVGRQAKPSAQSIRWDVRLLAGESVRFPKDADKNHYYQARDTDAVPLQTEVIAPEGQRDSDLRGGTVVQREKFLFYRGVGTFPTPVSIRALGEGKVRVTNASGSKLNGLVLVTVRGGAVGFKVLDELAADAQTEANLPVADGKPSDLAEVMVKELIGAGLYEKEARAMVKTWDSAWFGEAGTRLLYMVPRKRTDELLPLTIAPNPDEVVRVLVGRHDFLTPEQETGAERQLLRVRAAQAELQSAEEELGKIGRFAFEARHLAEKRMEIKATKK